VKPEKWEREIRSYVQPIIPIRFRALKAAVYRLIDQAEREERQRIMGEIEEAIFQNADPDLKTVDYDGVVGSLSKLLIDLKEREK
jgi:hypothetical protein